MALFKKIPKQVFLLGLVSFFTDFASEMLYPVTPLFLTVTLGASMSLVGLIEGIAEVTAGLLKGYFGNLSDKLGKRSVFVVLGYGLSSIVKPLPGFIPKVSTVIFSRTLDRVGKGIRTAPRDAILAANASGNTGAVFGFHRGMDTLGAVVGPLVAIALLHFYKVDYQFVYIAAIVPAILTILFTLTIKDVKSKKAGENSVKKYTYKEFWQIAPKRYKQLFVLFILFSFVNSSDVFLILKSKNISASDTLAIGGYVFYNIVYAIVSYPIGLMSDKFGKKNVFISGLFVFSLVYLGFAFNSSMIIIWLLFALYGIYSASNEGVIKAWVSDLIPGDYLGSAIGLLTMFSGFAMMTGSVVAGILWDAFGSSVPFLLSSAVSFVVGVLIFKLKSEVNK